MTSENAASLWDELRSHGYVSGDTQPSAPRPTPWYVRTMLGVGGWIGAAFLLGFVAAALSFIIKSPSAALLAGVGLLGIAWTIFHQGGRNEFANQFAFALSLSGQALILWGMIDGFGEYQRTIAALVAATSVVLLFVMPSTLHRIWSATVAILALAVLIADFGFAPYVPAVLLVGFCVLWINEYKIVEYGRIVRAVGYGLTFGLLVTLITRDAYFTGTSHWIGVQGWTPIGGATSLAVARMAIGFAFVGGVAALARRERVDFHDRGIVTLMIVAAIIGMLAFRAPGIALTLMVLIMGFANGNRVLAVLGGISLLLYLSKYYYFMDLSLLLKSLLLMGSGAALLLARYLLIQLWRAETPRHADA